MTNQISVPIFSRSSHEVIKKSQAFTFKGILTLAVTFWFGVAQVFVSKLNLPQQTAQSNQGHLGGFAFVDDKVLPFPLFAQLKVFDQDPPIKGYFNPYPFKVLAHWPNIRVVEVGITNLWNPCGDTSLPTNSLPQKRSHVFTLCIFTPVQKRSRYKNAPGTKSLPDKNAPSTKSLYIYRYK